MTLGSRLSRWMRASCDSRGQTGLDFIVGVGLFLLVIGFTIGFVPEMIDPYSEDAELPIVAERTATQVTERHLGVSTSPGELNRTATLAFFDPTAPTPRLDDVVAPGYSANVTAEGSIMGDPLVTDVLTVGENPPRDGSVATVRRVVAIDGETVVLTVRVWR